MYTHKNQRTQSYTDTDRTPPGATAKLHLRSPWDSAPSFCPPSFHTTVDPTACGTTRAIASPCGLGRWATVGIQQLGPGPTRRHRAEITAELSKGEET